MFSFILGEELFNNNFEKKKKGFDNSQNVIIDDIIKEGETERAHRTGKTGDMRGSKRRIYGQRTGR